MIDIRNLPVLVRQGAFDRGLLDGVPQSPIGPPLRRNVRLSPSPDLRSVFERLIHLTEVIESLTDLVAFQQDSFGAREEPLPRELET